MPAHSQGIPEKSMAWIRGVRDLDYVMPAIGLTALFAGKEGFCGDHTLSLEDRFRIGQRIETQRIVGIRTCVRVVLPQQQAGPDPVNGVNA